MNYRRKLLFYPVLYDHIRTNYLFIRAIRGNVAFHQRHCKEYGEILAGSHIQPGQIQRVKDLHKIPPLPTLFFKTHHLQSISRNRLLVNVTSSGTSGQRSHVSYDIRSLSLAMIMAWQTGRFHQLFSFRPTNYLILGYEPHPSNHTVITKTQGASRLYAPFILHTEYALRFHNGNYRLNFQILGRIGMDEIKTCAANASQILPH